MPRQTSRSQRRILVFTTAAAWGGAEVNVAVLLDALAAAGHEVTHLQLGHDVYASVARAAAGRYRTVPLSLPDAPSLAKVPRHWWERTIRQYDPDVCVLSKCWHGARSEGLDLAARAGGRRYVVVEHHPAQPPAALFAPHHTSLLSVARAFRGFVRDRVHAAASHRVIVDSRSVGEALHRHYGVSPAKTFLVPWGIDSVAFACRAEARAAIRTRWGIPADALVVGSVSRLEPVKALHHSIEAFAALREGSPDLDAWLVLAGIGSDVDRLRSVAAGLGVSDRVVTPGWVDDSADALSALDVFLMPSREEGLGMALLEAMACERPCVAMNSGGPADIITHSRLGWLTPADDQAAFTRAVLAAARAPADERQVIGTAARAHVREHFDQGRQVGRMVELIATV